MCFPGQHRFVEPAAAEVAAEPAHSREVERKQLLTRCTPPECARRIADVPAHRTPHRVDQPRSILVQPLAQVRVPVTDWHDDCKVTDVSLRVSDRQLSRPSSNVPYRRAN